MSDKCQLDFFNQSVWMRRLTILLFVLFLLPSCITSHAQTGGLMPYAFSTYLNSGGTAPAANGFLCSYAAGTTTPATTYQDSGLVTPNHNPIQLNSGGQTVAWGSSTGISVYLNLSNTYKFSEYRSGTGNTCNGFDVGPLIRTIDHITGTGSGLNIGGWTQGTGIIYPTTVANDVVIGSTSAASVSPAGGALISAGGDTKGLHILSGSSSTTDDLSINVNTTKVSITSGVHGGASYIPIELSYGGFSHIQFGGDTAGQIYIKNFNTAFTNPVQLGCCHQVVINNKNTDSNPVNAHTALEGYIDNIIGSDNSTVSAGVQGFAYADSPHVYSGTINGTTGICYSLLQTANAPVTVNECTGVYGRVTFYSSGSVNNAEAVKADMGSIIGTPMAVNNWYGFQAVAPTGVAGGSSIAKSALLHLETAGTLATTNWAIASEGGNSYHVGSFKIGDTDTTAFVAPDAQVGPFLILGDSVGGSVGELVIMTNTASTAHVVGAIDFANYNLGTAEKRIAVIEAITDGATNSADLQFLLSNAGSFTNTMTLFKTGDMSITRGFTPGVTLVGSLGSAASFSGQMRVVSDSTAVASEGQACVGGSGFTALAFSNGASWKCF